MAEQSLEPGAHLAQVFSERGAPLDAGQARQVLDTLLRLYELGVLVFEDPESCCPDSLPTSAPRSGVLGCGAPGGGDGPNAYNMGPSDSIKGDE